MFPWPKDFKIRTRPHQGRGTLKEAETNFLNRFWEAKARHKLWFKSHDIRISFYSLQCKLAILVVFKVFASLKTLCKVLIILVKPRSAGLTETALVTCDAPTVTAETELTTRLSRRGSARTTRYARWGKRLHFDWILSFLSQQLLTGEMCCYDLAGAKWWSEGKMRFVVFELFMTSHHDIITSSGLRRNAATTHQVTQSSDPLGTSTDTRWTRWHNNLVNELKFLWIIDNPVRIILSLYQPKPAFDNL